MLLLLRRHLVFRFLFFYNKIGFFSFLVLPTWLYSYKDYSCGGNLDGSHSFDGESSSKSMLLLLRRHLVFRFFPLR